MENSCRKCTPKASPRSLTAIAWNKLFFQMWYFEGGLSKSHKKLTFLLLKPIPFNEQNYKNKRDLKLVTSHSPGYKTSSEKFLD